MHIDRQKNTPIGNQVLAFIRTNLRNFTGYWNVACYLFLMITCITLFSVSLASAVEFDPEEKAFLEKKTVIRVHNETDWPPFNFYQNGKPQGISIDVMDRICEISGLKIIYVTGPSWSEFMDMIVSGKLDVMLNINVLPEREKFLQFTTPYSKSLTGLFVNKKNKRKYFSLNDLDGKTVAVPSGFDLEITVPKYHPNIKVLHVRDILECIEAVHSGKADAFLEEIGVTDYIMSQRMITDIRLAFQVSEKPFISSLAIAIPKANHLLYSVIQKSLNALPDEELHKIREKWLLNTNEIYEKSMVSLTVKEKEYLFKNKVVNICVDPSWPPLDFITEKGVHSGLSADLIQLISERIGLKLNLIPTKTWEQSLQFIRDGKCNIIPLMNETMEAKSYIDFTEPYFSFTSVIAARKGTPFVGNYSELRGKKLALQAHFFITEHVRKHYPGIDIVEVENTREALNFVSQQKAFATIDSLPTVVNTIEAFALKNIKIVGSVPQKNSMKIGVQKGNKTLLSILNKGISSLSEEEKVWLYKKWFDIEVANKFFNRSLLYKIGIAVCAIFLFLIWRQFTLKRYAGKLKILNEKLQYAATFDHLTKIFNRKSIEKRLKIEIQKTAISKEPLCLVILDIDHFKIINDSFGHLTGDTVLKQIANLVLKSIRKSDHFGRWGGEEFIIVLSNTGHKDAQRIMNALRVTISEHDFSLKRPVTVSMGVGQLHKKEKAASFLTRVDNSLYAAKKKGRNIVVNAEVN